MSGYIKVQEVNLVGTIVNDINLKGHINPTSELRGSISIPEIVYLQDMQSPSQIKLGHALYYDNDGALNVKMAQSIDSDNTLPITSALVATQIGNIEILLKTI